MLFRAPKRRNGNPKNVRLSGGSALELREVPSTSRTFSRIQRLAAETEQEQIGTDWNWLEQWSCFPGNWVGRTAEENQFWRFLTRPPWTLAVASWSFFLLYEGIVVGGAAIAKRVIPHPPALMGPVLGLAATNTLFLIHGVYCVYSVANNETYCENSLCPTHSIQPTPPNPLCLTKSTSLCIHLSICPSHLAVASPSFLLWLLCFSMFSVVSTFPLLWIGKLIENPISPTPSFLFPLRTQVG